MMPEIEFVYSWIYDEGYRNSSSIKEYLAKNKMTYPSSKKILRYLKEVEKPWRKIENKILREMSTVSGLMWRDKKIKCYIIGCGIPFSDPLTIGLYKNKNDFIDTLIHEMIHQLFTQKGNYEKAAPAWKYIYKKYKRETYKTKIHIPLHAIHSHIYFKFFSEKRLNEDIRGISHLKDYKRSWEIVKKEGYEEIIRKFRGLIK